jgi:hypothetical protein
MAKDRKFSSDDWDRLAQLAQISKLGSSEKEEK